MSVNTAGVIPEISGLRRIDPQASAPDGADGDPAHPYWYTDPHTGFGVSANITPEAALRVSAVMGCVKVLSESVAMLPLKLYRRLPGGGREPARDHPLYRILAQKPSDTLTSLEWREMAMVHMTLRGAAYSEIVRNGAGDVVRLDPIHPDLVEVKKTPEGSFQFDVRDKDNPAKKLTLGHSDVLYLRGMTTDGVNALSPIAYARRNIGLAIETEAHGSALFRNGARPSGVLTHPAELSDKAQDNIRAGWMRRFSGKNAGSIAILQEDMKYQDVGMTSEDAQFLETRRYQVEEIARIYRVPLTFLQDDTHATFSNITQKSLDFVIHTLGSWLVRIEQRINATLINDDDLFCEHLVDGLLRGDPETRSNALSIQFRNGIITQDEWRALELRNPIPDGQGKRHYVPAELIPIESLARKAQAEIDAALLAADDSGDAFAVEDLRFKKEVLLKFLQDGTTNDVVYNLTAVRQLLEEVNIPVSEAGSYQEPVLPVIAASGRLISGDVIKDPAGDVVSGDVLKDADDGKGNSPNDNQDGRISNEPVGDLPDGEEDDNSEPDPQENMRFIRPIIVDLADRLVRSEAKTLAPRLEHRDGDPERFAEWAEGFYAKRCDHVAKLIAPLAIAVKASGGTMDSEAIVSMLSGTDRVRVVCEELESVNLSELLASTEQAIERHIVTTGKIPATNTKAEESTCAA